MIAFLLNQFGLGSSSYKKALRELGEVTCDWSSFYVCVCVLEKIISYLSLSNELRYRFEDPTPNYPLISFPLHL